MDAKKGEQWYVQLGEKSTLVQREVVDITAKTILLRNRLSITQFNELRYVISDIKLIEKV